MSESDMLKLLANRYAAPEFVFLPRVRNGTGYSRGRTRYADALAMSVWPSRGLDLHGFEIKVSRSDWLREKKNPQKAEDIAKYCDFWWLAAADSSIVLAGELPPTWGLLIHKGGKLLCEANATKLEAAPLDRLLLASILRSVCDGMVSRDSIQDELNKASASAAEAARGESKYKLESAQRALKEVREQLKTIEEKTGLNLDKWDLGPQAEAIKALTDIARFRFDKDRCGDGLFGAVNRTRQLLGNLEALAKGLSEIGLPESTP